MHIKTIAAAAILAATIGSVSAFAAGAQPQPEPIDNFWRLPVPDVARDEPHPPVDVLARLQPGATSQVRILNIGDKPLIISNINLGGVYAQQFQINIGDCVGKQIAPETSCSMTVSGEPVDGMFPGDRLGASVLATYNDGEFADALVTVEAPADATNNTIVGDAK